MERTMMENTVQERIDDYLDQAFGPYEDSPTVSELRIEVRHDLLERLNDLLEHGVGSELAYAQVISSVGDIEATIREFAEKDRVLDEEISQPSPDQPAADEAPPVSGFQPTAQQPVREPTPEEPAGPAHQIPDGEAPGASWQEQTETPDSASNKPEDWVSSVITAVTDGLDSVLTEVSSALENVGGSFIHIGLWNDETLKERTREWEQRWGQGSKVRVTFATDLKGGDFTGQDLSKRTWVAATIRRADFTGADLTSSSFKTSDLRKSVFNQANMTGISMVACSVRDCQFERTNLSEAVLSTCDMRRISFIGCNLRGVRAKFSDFRAATFNDCAMDGANFTGADMRRVCFDGLSLNSVNFSMSNLTEASFKGATLRNVNFHHVSRRVVAAIVFDDTVVDSATLRSLRASGHNPQGIRLED